MLAISTAALPPRASVADWCHLAASLQIRSLCIADHDVAPAPGDMQGALTRTGVRVRAVHAGCLEARTGLRRPSEDLASPDAARRARALRSLQDHVAFAAALGATAAPIMLIPPVVGEAPGIDERGRHLEGMVSRGENAGESIEELKLLSAHGRDRHLESLCRSLHAATRAHPNITFAIAPAARPQELLITSALRDVLADVRATNLQLWFNAGRARSGERLGSEPPIDVLPQFASRLAAVYLTDSRGVDEGGMPGEGDVDWRLMAEHLPRTALRILNPGVASGAARLREAVRLAASLGLES